MERGDLTYQSETLAWPLRVTIGALIAVVLIGGVIIFEFMTVPPPEPSADLVQRPVREFAAPKLAARAAIVYDIANDRILYEKNADAQLPLASLTKIMTAYVAATTLERHMRVAIGADAIAVEGDSGFTIGDTFSVRDLLRFTLTTSSNDGAHALASAVAAQTSGSRAAGSFVTQMNTVARELGLVQTYFTNPTGLDQSTALAGGYGSAADVARLLGAAHESLPDELAATADEITQLTSADRQIDGENTNPITPTIPNLLASKTGFTDLAGGNLGIIFDIGIDRPIAIVVLGSGFDERFSDTQALLDATLVYFEPPRL